MKKTIGLLLALMMATALFAGCGENKTLGTDPGTSQSTDPGRTAPATSAVTPDPITVTEKQVRIMLWGDSVFCTNNMFDLIGLFALQDGMRISTTAATYNNFCNGETFSLYELYKFDGSKATSKIKSINTTGSAAKLVNAMTDPNLYDYFVILAGKDRALGLPDAKGRILTAEKDIGERYYASNPNGRTVVVGAPAFASDCTLFTKWGMSADTTPEQHSKMISDFAAEFAAQFEGETQLALTNEAFAAFIEKNPDSGIDFYAEDRRSLSIDGSYYLACLLYGMIFGKSPAGMEVYGLLDSATAKILQNAAHEFVFGTSAADYVRTPVIVKTETVQDTRFAGEKYPEYFDILYSAAVAYENRGTLIQYDQMGIDKVGKTCVRRQITDSYPENNSPQKVLYLDCSAFICSLFDTAFDFDFHGTIRVNAMLTTNNDSLVFYWDAEKPNLSPEEAAAAFTKTLVPGDVVAFSDFKDTVGHIMLYVGNGEFIHCTGAKSLGGGGVDYNYNLKKDCLEMFPCGIVRDKIDVLTEPYGARYLFTGAIKVCVLRPLSLDIKPTAQAQTRFDNMQDLVAYTLTSASEGLTTNIGETVFYDIVIKNLGDTERPVSVSMPVPSGLSYLEGGTYANNAVAFEGVVKPRETLTFSYKVKVSETAALGDSIESAGAINGVPLNITEVDVGKTLTS